MTTMVRELRWVKEARVSEAAPAANGGPPFSQPTPRERLVAALADRPRTVAQLAQAFELSQPTMLDQVRRALRDGLISEVMVAEEERRFPAERYYATAVPVIRQPDREVLESACLGLAADIAVALTSNLGDLHAAFGLTHLAREGWSFEALWPYLQETISRLTIASIPGISEVSPPPSHGLAWVEEVTKYDAPSDVEPEHDHDREEKLA